jgi:hypothetical protein
VWKGNRTTSAILVTQILAQPAAANYAVPSSTRLPKPLAICDLNFTKQTHFPCQVEENNATFGLKSNPGLASPSRRNRNISSRQDRTTLRQILPCRQQVYRPFRNAINCLGRVHAQAGTWTSPRFDGASSSSLPAMHSNWVATSAYSAFTSK